MQSSFLVFSFPFEGPKWYEYRGSRLLRHGHLKDLGLPASVKKIDATVIWEGNSMPYFFIGNSYYRFNEERGRVDKGYPKPITPNWVNIPGNVGATFGSGGKKIQKEIHLTCMLYIKS